MFLFEAIMLGAMTTKQTYRSLMNEDGGTCAMGAAIYAAGLAKTRHEFTQLAWRGRGDATQAPEVLQAFPIVRHTITRNTIHGPELIYVGTMIMVKNDGGMTREAIAQWLEPIERQYYADRQGLLPADVVAEVIPEVYEVEAEVVKVDKNGEHHGHRNAQATRTSVGLCSGTALLSERSHEAVGLQPGGSSPVIPQRAGRHLFWG